MQDPRLTVGVITRDGRRLGFYVDLTPRVELLVASNLEQMAALLRADAERCDSPATDSSDREPRR